MRGQLSRRLLAAAGVALVCAIVLLRPHVVQRWALYLGSPAEASEARLYLDPFPSEKSCRSRVAVFTQNAEHAFCASSEHVEVGSSDDAILATDFRFLFLPGWYCTPVRRVRTPPAVSRRADRTSVSSSTSSRNRTT